MSPIKTASVLAFERKLYNSDELMYSGSSKNHLDEQSWKTIKLQNIDVRGIISNRIKSSLIIDPLKL